MTESTIDPTWHERRLARHLEARGEPGYVEALLGLKGVIVGGRHRIETLYAVGGESAVFLTRDVKGADGAVKVAKIALLPVHRPFWLKSQTIKKQRDGIRIESSYLKGLGSRFLPHHEGMFEFENPLLDSARGGAFRESEPLLLMEKLPGRDLDRWLARMHRSDVPQDRMRRTLDRVAVVLLAALVDLYDRGFIYADLRPANLRVIGRPERIVRLLDAGSLVRVDDKSGRFPHVPSYLPPSLFRDLVAGRMIVPSALTQTIMAGRTLYEVATGRVPHAGRDVDLEMLEDSNVSPPVAEVVESLCEGGFEHIRHAYRFLAKRAQRRVHGANDPTKATQVAPVTKSPPEGSPAAKTPPAKKGAAKKTPATRTPAKKAPGKKVPGKKVPAKQGAGKKSPGRTAAPRKRPAPVAGDQLRLAPSPAEIRSAPPPHRQEPEPPVTSLVRMKEPSRPQNSRPGLLRRLLQTILRPFRR